MRLLPGLYQPRRLRRSRATDSPTAPRVPGGTDSAPARRSRSRSRSPKPVVTMIGSSATQHREEDGSIIGETTIIVKWRISPRTSGQVDRHDTFTEYPQQDPYGRPPLSPDAQPVSPTVAPAPNLVDLSGLGSLIVDGLRRDTADQDSSDRRGRRPSIPELPTHMPPARGSQESHASEDQAGSDASRSVGSRVFSALRTRLASTSLRGLRTGRSRGSQTGQSQDHS